MATLHMDVSVARSIQKKLETALTNLEQQLHDASNAVMQLESGSWQGQSAQQFYDKFHTWENNARRLCEELRNLTTALRNEITQWENMAQRLEG